MTDSRASEATLTLGALLLIVALAYLAIRAVQPPPAAPANAPATDFSAARALEDLKVIAQRPHPTGSEENDRVRAYLLERLRAMGLDPHVQTATALRTPGKRPGPISAATVHNILARLPGTSSTRPIMLAAHYDSVPTGPGASDDGAGVVTLLETLRALTAGPSLRNDLILLFTDGEERGLLGAKAFVDEHPWAKIEALVLNFEARGSCGPSSMFETSAQNGWLVYQFAQAAPRPVASSLFYEAYKRLPNDTDFSIFKRADLEGLNFAYTGCWPRYHTRRDDVEDIDLGSLQHHGSNALALTRHFGNRDLSNVRGEDRVYFTVPGAGVVSYPQDWAVPLALVALAAFATLLVLGVRRGVWRWRAVAYGFAWVGTSFVASTVASQLAWRALTTSGAIGLLPYGMAYKSEQVALGLLAVTVGIAAALYASFRKNADAQDLAVGTLVWSAALAPCAAWLLPGGSYLFLWPLVLALFPMGLGMAVHRPVHGVVRKEQASSAAIGFVWILPAAGGALLLAPVLYLILILLSTSGLILEAFLATLLLGLLAPQLELLGGHRGPPLRGRAKWLLPAGAALLGLGLVATTVFTSQFDARHPRADSIFYYLDSDTGKASWVSLDRAPDDWTSQFLARAAERVRLGDFLPLRGPALASPAPAAPLPAPALMPLDDLTIGESRLLRLQASSLRNAPYLWVVVEKGEIRHAKLNGKPLAPGAGAGGAARWALVYSGLPKEGLDLTLEVSAREPLAIRVTDQTDGLPSLDGIQIHPRPESLMPSPTAPFDSSTLVSKTFRFEVTP